jgi:hypothetical protein
VHGVAGRSERTQQLVAGSTSRPGLVQQFNPDRRLNPSRGVCAGHSGFPSKIRSIEHDVSPFCAQSAEIQCHDRHRRRFAVLARTPTRARRRANGPYRVSIRAEMRRASRWNTASNSGRPTPACGFA